MEKSAISRVYQSRASLKDRGKRFQMGRSAVQGIGAGLLFAGDQYKRSKSAWEDYEAGYKDLTGEDYQGDEGWFAKAFRMPKGEVSIGGQEYEKETISRLGSILKNPMYDDDLIRSYKTRVLGYQDPTTQPTAWESATTGVRENVYSDTGEAISGFGKGAGMNLANNIGRDTSNIERIDLQLADDKTGSLFMKRPTLLEEYQTGETYTKGITPMEDIKDEERFDLSSRQVSKAKELWGEDYRKTLFDIYQDPDANIEDFLGKESMFRNPFRKDRNRLGRPGTWSALDKKYGETPYGN